MSAFLVTLVGILGFILTIAAGVGSVAAFRISRNTETVRTYKENAAAWKERSEQQDVEITDLRSKIADQAKLIADLQGQLHTLSDVVTGRAAITELGQQLAKYMGDLAAQVGNIATTVTEHNQKVIQMLQQQGGNLGNQSSTS